jgi:sec1 family domain-containing protein 1
VTEENLFSCGIPNVYHTLNSPTAAETVIEDTINRIVSSLFSVAVTMGISFIVPHLRTLGTMPIIRCPKSNAAEMISQRLDGKLRDYFLNSHGTPTNVYSTPYQERPSKIPSELCLIQVMVILDRNLDLIPMISHSWTVPLLVYLTDIVPIPCFRCLDNQTQSNNG